jgi:hypothetical protein
MRLTHQDTITMESGPAARPIDPIAQEAEASRTVSPTEVLLDFLVWEGGDARAYAPQCTGTSSSKVAAQPATADDRFDWWT